MRLQFGADTQSTAINIQDNPTASISLEIGPEIGSLALESLSALTAVELERLSSLRVLRLENLAVLEDLTAFSDIEAVSKLHLRNLPLISTAEVDAFLAQLIEAPDVSSCGLRDGSACAEGDLTEPDN